MQILTNSFPIAEHLLHNSKNTITVPGGAIYREQNIILSPFENDVTHNFFAHRMFTSARGISSIGVMEGDPLLIQAEQKLINQAEELVLLIDSSKFQNRSSLILCPLERVHTVITDDGISTRDAKHRRTGRNPSHRGRSGGERRVQGVIVGGMRRADPPECKCEVNPMGGRRDMKLLKTLAIGTAMALAFAVSSGLGRDL